MKNKKREVMLFQSILSIMILLLSGLANASAKNIVGIIASVDGNVTIASVHHKRIDFGDDLIEKDRVKIGANSSLMITYYDGCKQEYFDENSEIEIGEKGSTIIYGKIQKSEYFDCVVPEVVLNERDSSKRATYHFRGIESISASAGKTSLESKRTDLTQQSDAHVKLRVWTAKKDQSSYRSGEQIILYLIADRDAYLKLDYFQADGTVVHLIPNLFEEKQKMKAGHIYVVGGNRSKVKLMIEHPYGRESFSALVSVVPFENEFQSMEVIENSLTYRERVKRVLSNNLQIAEYRLDIRTMP